MPDLVKKKKDEQQARAAQVRSSIKPVDIIDAQNGEAGKRQQMRAAAQESVRQNEAKRYWETMIAMQTAANERKRAAQQNRVQLPNGRTQNYGSANMDTYLRSQGALPSPRSREQQVQDSVNALNTGAMNPNGEDLSSSAYTVRQRIGDIRMQQAQDPEVRRLKGALDELNTRLDALHKRGEQGDVEAQLQWDRWDTLRSRTQTALEEKNREYDDQVVPYQAALDNYDWYQKKADALNGLTEAEKKAVLTMPVKDKEEERQRAMAREGQYKYDSDYISDAGRKVLEDKFGKDEAKEYVAYIRRLHDAEMAEQKRSELRAQTQENGWTAAGMSAASVPVNVMGGVVGAADAADQWLERMFTDRPINYNTAQQQVASMAPAIREAVNESISNIGMPPLATKAAQLVYSTGMSMADSAAAMAIGGEFGGVLLGMNAGVQGMREAKQRGLSDEKAILTGLVNGAAEMIFEEVSIEKLYQMKGAKDAADALKNIGWQALTEGSEEVATTLGNTVGDLLLNGTNSDWKQKLRQYVREGYSEKEAKAMVWKDLGLQLTEDFIGGALSGLAFGTFGQASQDVRNRKTGKALLTNGTQKQVAAFIQNFTDVKNMPEIQQMAARMEAGTLTKRQAGALISDVVSRLSTQAREGGESGKRAQAQIALLDTLIRTNFDRAAQTAGRQDAAQMQQETENAAPAQRGIDAASQAQTEQNAARAQEENMPGGENAVQGAQRAQNAREGAYGGDASYRGTVTVRTGEDGRASRLFADDFHVDKNGEVTLKAYPVQENGEPDFGADPVSVSASDAQFADTAVGTLYRSAQDMGLTENDMRSFMEGYTGHDHSGGAVTPEQYADAFRTARQLASQGRSVTEVMRSINESNEGFALDSPGYIHVEALNDQALYAATRQQGRAGQTGGVNLNAVRTEMSDNTLDAVNALDAFARSIGRTVNVTDHLDAPEGTRRNGMFDPETNAYTVALDAVGDAYLFVAVHESVHDIAVNSALGYANLKDVVFDILKDKGENVEELIAYQEGRLRGEMTEAERRERAEEEVVANTVPVILRDEQFGRRFAERFARESEDTRSWFVKLLDKIKGALDKGYAALRNQKAWRQMRRVENDRKALARIREAYFAALEDRTDTAKGGDVRDARNSIVDDGQGHKYVVWDRAVIHGDDPKAWGRQVTDYINKEIRHGRDVRVVSENGVVLTITEDTAGKAAFRNNVVLPDGSTRLLTDEEYARKLRAETHVDELAQVSKGKGKSAADRKGHEFSRDGFTYREAYFRDDTGYYKITFSVGKTGRINTIYNIGRIENATLPTVAAQGRARSKTEREGSRSNGIVRNSETEVNSLEEKNFKPMDPLAEETYRYENLVAQKSMEIVQVKSLGEIFTNGRIIQNDISAKGRANALKYAESIIDGNPVIRNRYTNGNIVVTSQSIDHGLEGDFNRLSINARLTEKIGALVKNAMPINQFLRSEHGAADSYVLAALARGGDSDFLALLHVGAVDNSLRSMEIVDVLHSLNGRRKNTDRSQPRLLPNDSIADIGVFPAVKIARVLEIVKEMHPDVLPMDVLKHFNIQERPAGYYKGKAAVRYSEDELLPDLDELKADNEALGRALDEADREIRHLRGEMRQTQGRQISGESAMRIAREVQKQYASRYRAAELAQEITGIYDYLFNDREGSADEAIARGVAMMKKVLEQSSRIDTESEDYAPEMRRYIREYRLNIDDPQVQEAAEAYGGIGKFRRANFGRLNLTKDGADVNAAWEDLAQRYPDRFSGDPSAGKLEQILRALDQTEPQIVNPFGYDLDEAAADAFLDLTVKLYDAPEARTFADRQKAKLKEAVRAVRQAARAEYDQRLADQAEQDRRARQELAQRYQNASEAQKEKLREEYRARTKERLRGQRERAATRELKGRLRKRIEDTAGRLQKKLITNSQKEHIPESLKQVVGGLLASLDFSSDRAARGGLTTKKDTQLMKSLYQLKDALTKQANALSGTEESGAGFYLDMPPEAIEEIDILTGDAKKNAAEAAGLAITSRVRKMDTQQLQQLDKLLRTISTAVNNINRTHENAAFSTVTEMAETSIRDMDRMKEAGNALTGEASSFLLWQMATPVYAFDRFGAGGKAAFDGIAAGFEKFARNIETLNEDAEKIFTKKEAEAWRTQRLDVKLENGETISMTVAQAMNAYMHTRREQSRQHYEVGGIFIDETGKGKKRVRDPNVHHVTEGDMAAIAAALTDEQRAAAEKMQRYMSTKGRDLGNEISMRRFGIRQFSEENYVRIRTRDTVRNLTDAAIGENNSIVRLLNMSFGRQLTPNANNALVIEDAFDAFYDHMVDMAKYNALALPVLDAMRWVNYRTTDYDEQTGHRSDRGVQEAMERAWGKQARRYFQEFMRDVNGANAGESGMTGFFNKLLGRARAAQVGANVRVALLQPTSYTRARLQLSGKAFWKAQALVWNLKRWDRSIRELHEYSGITKWKDLGFREIQINRGLKAQALERRTPVEWLREKSMIMAEFGDKITWGMLWEACKIEVHDQTGLDMDDDMLKERAAIKFRDMATRTQIYDSPITRSPVMRSKDGGNKMLTAFMAEPILTYNTVVAAGMEASMEKRATGRVSRKASAKLMGAVGVYLWSAVNQAVVESIIDAVRDDDDYESFLQKFLQALFGDYEGARSFSDVAKEALGSNLISDLNPASKIPFARDIISLLTGYGVDREDIAAISETYSALQTFMEYARLNWLHAEDAEKTKLTYYGKMTGAGVFQKLNKSLSQVTGVPLYGVTREVFSFVDTIERELYYGGITASNPRTFQTYASPSGGYGYLYNALVDGNARKAQLFRDEILSYGATENDIRKGIKACIKEDLAKGTITQEEAEKRLIDLCGFDPEATGGNSAYYAVQQMLDSEYTIGGELKLAMLEGSREDVQKAVETLKEAYGYDAAKIRTAAANGAKEAYISGDAETRRVIRQRLYDTGAYGSLDELDKKLKEWLDKAA